MNRSLEKMIMPEDPLMLQAIEAMKLFQEAKDLGASPEEIERLRILAESLFQAITDYQLRALGGADYTCH